MLYDVTEGKLDVLAKALKYNLFEHRQGRIVLTPKRIEIYEKLKQALKLSRYIVRHRFDYVTDSSFATNICQKFKLDKEYVLRILEALRYIYMSFSDKSESWYIRCLTRYMMGVEYCGRTWIVKGNRELRNHYPYYYVNFLPKAEKYFCTCFLNRYGKIREKKYAHI